VECIRQRSEQESGNGKELLVKMMEVFVLKFKTVSKLHLPVLLAKHRPPPPPPSLSSSSAVPQHAPLTPGPPSLAPMPSPATPRDPPTPATPATPDIKSEADVKPVPSPGPTSSLSQVLAYYHLLTCVVIPHGVGRTSQGTSAPGCTSLAADGYAHISLGSAQATDLFSAVCVIAERSRRLHSL